MPCYRCGTRQVDPEAGKSSPWRRGVVHEHQVLVCPACAPAALADLSRCVRCGSAHLIRRLDQVECLDCRLIRDAEPESPPPRATDPADTACPAGPSGSAGPAGPSGSAGPAGPSGSAGPAGPSAGPAGPSAGPAGPSGATSAPDAAAASAGLPKSGGPAASGGAAPSVPTGDLAAEVARALDKVLGRR